MEKYCKNCDRIYDDNPDGVYCSQCGGKYEDYLPDLSRVGGNSQPKMDNRLYNTTHNGPETHIGRDRVDNIDNSTHNTTTTNNTSNTTITNVYHTHAEESVECAISGRNLPKNEIFRCKKCNRLIWVKYYVEADNCCKECCESIKSTRAIAPADFAPVLDKETFIGMLQDEVGNDVNPNTSAPVAYIVPVPQETDNNPIRQTVSPTYNDDIENKPTVRVPGWAIIAVSIVAIAAVCLFLFNSGHDNDDTEDGLVAESVEEQPVSNAVSAHTGTAQNRPEASSQKNAATNNPIASEAPAPDNLELGEKAYNAGEYSKARVFLEKAATEGKAKANYYLGLLYMNGNGIGIDSGKAFSYMKKAAEGNVPSAYFILAEMYRNGEGTEANRNLAKQWYEKTVMYDNRNSDRASQILELYE